MNLSRIMSVTLFFALLQQGIAQDIDSPEKLVASMTKYQVGVLWKGAKWNDESAALVDARIHEASHVWKRAVTDGKLVGAIRIADPKDLWGLLFFKNIDQDEMKAIAGNSLSVKEGLLAGTVLTVWGTRGLGQKLAEELKSDPDAEMTREQRYMVIFRKGEEWSEKSDDPSTRTATADGIRYLYKLYEGGDLLYYATLEDFSKQVRGMAIINAESPEEAMEIASGSPMVKKKWLTAEVTPVYLVGGVLP